MKTSPVIAIAAGGTGGHIFPAIATGNKLQEMVPGCQVLYACGERPLEVGLYESNGVQPVIFPARQLRSGIVHKAFGMLAATGNLWRAWRWLRSINADVVIGFGGYVSGPTVLAAKLGGFKTAIHEANSVPGRTNRILGPWMNLTAAHFESTLKVLGGKNQVATGMPIRQLESAATKQQARSALGLDPDMDTLLIMGGSQGAKFLYESIIKILPQLDNRLNSPLQILWSTGEAHHASLEESARTLDLHHINLKLVPFIRDMGNAFKAADLALARSGASALAELTSFGVFTLYVPFPGAIYNHQTLNAREAERYGTGIVIDEKQVPELMVEKVLESLEKIHTGYQPVVPQAFDSTLAAERLAGEIIKILS